MAKFKGKVRDKQRVLANGKRVWVADITIDGARSEKYFERKKEANDHLEGVRKKVTDHTYSAEGEKPFGEVLDAFYEHCERRHKGGDLRAATLRSWRVTIYTHVKPALGKYEVGDERLPMHCQDLINDLAAKGYLGTLKVIRNVISFALDFAVDRHWLGRNKLRDKRLRVPPRATDHASRIRIPTLDEVRALLTAAMGDRAHQERHHAHEIRLIVVAIPIFAGLRRGEVAGLEWQHIDLEEGTIHVKQAHNPDSRHMNGGIGCTKTSSGVRSVPMAPELVALLERYWDYLGQPPTGRILIGERGTPVDAANLNALYFQPVMRKAGLGGLFRYHDLRHFYASTQIAKRVPPTEIAVRMGHRGMAEIQRTYGHLIVGYEMSRAASAEIGRELLPDLRPLRHGRDKSGQVLEITSTVVSRSKAID